MVPPFDSQSGALPPGEHLADWDEISELFGWNLRRRRLLDGLAEGLAVLASAGSGRVWLNGSFVTTKEEPADFHCVWDPTGVDLDVIREAGPELLDLGAGRTAQKQRFGDLARQRGACVGIDGAVEAAGVVRSAALRPARPRGGHGRPPRRARGLSGGRFPCVDDTTDTASPSAAGLAMVSGGGWGGAEEEVGGALGDFGVAAGEDVAEEEIGRIVDALCAAVVDVCA